MTDAHRPVKWRVVGASVIGTSHVKLGKECEDSHTALRLDDGTLIVAVADGGGSAPRAADGSEGAVDTAVALARARLTADAYPQDATSWTAFYAALFADVRAELARIASQLRPGDVVGKHAITGTVRDVATTLLMVIVTPTDAAIGQVGDGAVVVRTHTDAITAVTTPTHGAQVNETRFLTDPSFQAYLQTVVLSAADVTGIAVFSDGIERLALNDQTNEPTRPLFVELFKFAAADDAATEDVEAWLNSERVCQRTDDDKTLVLAVRA